MNKKIEIWADSFHEGNWCCDNISHVASELGCDVRISFDNGFQPHYTISSQGNQIDLLVFGSYRSWEPVPDKIDEILNWGKPDFIAYDPDERKVLFAVEETAATPTGNQAMQRCERQYGSARFRIPYWYLISEFGVHKDGGVRRDSIWPTIAAIKLSVYRQTPCMVLHYSDIDNPEDYNSGSGVALLFKSLFGILDNYVNGRDCLTGLKGDLTAQYKMMLEFLGSQWENIIDFLPGESKIHDPRTSEALAGIATHEGGDLSALNGFLVWPLIPQVDASIRRAWVGKKLIKFDPLCERLENDINQGLAYYLSDNAGSGRPPSSSQVKGWVAEQKALFAKEKQLDPPAVFTMKLEDFPDTGNGGDRRHLTTAKNIVYLYDSWNAFVESVWGAYPRLKKHIQKQEVDQPVFVYVSNTIKKGRLFGDPFTGQLAAFSTAFGKFDHPPRKVVAYFPHQVHTQAILKGKIPSNKGITLMTELTDLVIFNAGVAVDLKNRRVM